jgi:hypothetical protein
LFQIAVSCFKELFGLSRIYLLFVLNLSLWFGSSFMFDFYCLNSSQQLSMHLSFTLALKSN